MNQTRKKISDLDLTFGRILRAKLEFKGTDTHRNKFLIVVGEDKRDKEILFFLTTSQIEKIPSLEHIQSNMVHIKTGEIDCFKLETVIDCRTIHKRPKDWFKELFAKSLLGTHGALPQIYQDKIKQVVFKSPFLSQHHRNIILEKL